MTSHPVIQGIQGKWFRMRGRGGVGVGDGGVGDGGVGGGQKISIKSYAQYLRL